MEIARSAQNICCVGRNKNHWQCSCIVYYLHTHVNNLHGWVYSWLCLPIYANTTTHRAATYVNHSTMCHHWTWQYQVWPAHNCGKVHRNYSEQLEEACTHAHYTWVVRSQVSTTRSGQWSVTVDTLVLSEHHQYGPQERWGHTQPFMSQGTKFSFGENSQTSDTPLTW